MAFLLWCVAFMFALNLRCANVNLLCIEMRPLLRSSSRFLQIRLALETKRHVVARVAFFVPWAAFMKQEESMPAATPNSEEGM